MSRVLLQLVLLAAIAAAVVVAARAGDASPPVPAPAARTDYTAIGDSVTGTGAAAPNGWVKLYARAIDADSVVNLARNGWTGGDILHALRYDPLFRDAVAGSSLITLNAGMNEFFTGRDLYSKGVCGGPDGEACLRHMVARFEGWWDQIVAELRALAPDARLIVLTLYHPLQVFDQRFGWAPAINEHLALMNAHIVRTPGVEVADVFTAYNGDDGLADPIARGFILPDAVHGTDLGHQVIAGVLTRLDRSAAAR